MKIGVSEVVKPLLADPEGLHRAQVAIDVEESSSTALLGGKEDEDKNEDEPNN